jgi:molybdate transport system substrate-binding protein
MGIATEINARATVVPMGFTAERLITGEADVAIQQLSELKQVNGIEVVGPLPHHLQTPAVFSAGRMTASKNVAAADLLLRFLSSPDATPALIESGLERLA